MRSILESFCDSLGEQEQQEVRRGEVLDSGKEGRVSCCCFSRTGFHWVVLSVLELSLYRPGWSRTQEIYLSCLPTAEIKGICLAKKARISSGFDEECEKRRTD